MAIRLLFVGLTCCLVLFVFVYPMAAPSPLERVYLSSGEVILVTEHRFDGDRVFLSLISGGEVIGNASLIEKIEPAQPILAIKPKTDHFESMQRPVKFRPYFKLVENAAKEHDVDPIVLHAIIQAESSYQHDAVSPRGAMGLMQLMPKTVVQYKVKDPFDPMDNIDAGARYIRSLLDQFGMKGALAAYNAGPSSVRKFGGIPPYPETRLYVDRVLAFIEEARNE